MRNYLLSMLSCVTLLMACQPVTPLPVRTESAGPNLKINDNSSIPPASMSPPVTQTPPVPSVPAEGLSSVPVEQNNNQNEIDLAVRTITKSSKTRTNSEQASPNITPKAVVVPKTFDPATIIGFSKPILVYNLGRANMVRREGPMEVWQYQFVSCVVDFFLYPIDEGSSQLILKSWDMRSTIMGDHLDRGSCRDEMNLYHQKFLSNS